MSLVITTFDVEHGNSHLIETPNEKLLMIDAGSKATFSPSKHVFNSRNRGLDWFTLTHHDSDHLTDVENLFTLAKPKTISRPVLTQLQLNDFYPQGLSSYLESFLRFESTYTGSAESIESPIYDWGGVKFSHFRNLPSELPTKNINNLSLVTFVDYMGWTFLFPGDLEKEGWQALLKHPDFLTQLETTDVLVASHHGRESGYCEEVFEFLEPFLVIISDKSITDTSITDKYYEKVQGNGLKVYNEAGILGQRFVLTTRKDGAIRFEISEEGYDTIKLFNT